MNNFVLIFISFCVGFIIAKISNCRQKCNHCLHCNINYSDNNTSNSETNNNKHNDDSTLDNKEDYNNSDNINTDISVIRNITEIDNLISMYQKENCEIEECVKVAIQGYISTFPGEHIFYMLNKVDSQRVILLLTSNPDLYKLRQDKILMKQVETYLDNQKKLKKLEVERLYAS